MMATIPEQFSLAVEHHQAGRLQAAESLYRQILAVEPNHADAIHLLGMVAYQQGQHEVAAQFVQRAIALDGNAAVFHNNLSQVFKDQGKLDEAVACCRRALELKPDYATAHNNLGNALNLQGKLDEAVACYRRAVELQPDYAVAHNNLGNALNVQGKRDEALACYHRAVGLKPDFAAVHYNLGAHYHEIGDFENAQRSWRDALRHDARHAKSLAGLATLLRARLPDHELATIEHLASSAELTAGERAALHFGIASVRDAQADYAAAAQHYVHANSLSLADHRSHGHAEDPEAHDRLVTAVIETFSSAHFERVRGFGVDSERPVFIFGLPRTGTTLTEQILAGHTKVFGAGELQLAGKMFASLPQVTMTPQAPLECVAALDRQTSGALARRYLERLDAINACALRIVDKMPDNYLHLGFLMTLFPKAKFIHCRRDLRDVAVSCWMTDFREIYWSNDVNHIAARFRAYERLMEHWRRVLPAPILDVDYEATVADLEGSARRLIDWCGLDWEPPCASFHTRRGPVRTASAAQVRQPIYQHAVGRWKLYEEFLAPLLAAVNDRND